jgi:TPR repeat protein
MSAGGSVTNREALHFDEYEGPPSLDPTPMPEICPPPRPQFKLGAFSSLALAVAVAAIIAFFFVAERFPDPRTVPWANDRSHARLSLEHPQLAVNQEASRIQGDAFPLAAKVAGPVEGAVVFVKGLAAGSTLSLGRPLGTTGWWLAAADLANARIRPPSDFVGLMDVVLELRRANDSLLDRKSVRLEWRPRQSVAGQEESTGNPTRQLDRQEVAELTRRGEKFIVIGDLASARLVLQHAAEAGDPRAALMLAATYDPIVLEKVGIQGFGPDLVQGFAPDIALARNWYARAKEFGSTEAVRRLQALSSLHFGNAPKE